MRLALQWSYDLLRPRAQRVLQILSLLPGGFDAALGDGVCSRVVGSTLLDEIVELVDCGMLRTDDHTGLRLRMSEVVRQFARDALRRSGSEGLAETACAQELLAFARAHGPSDPEALVREDANLDRALRWFIENGESEPAMELCLLLWRSWDLQGRWTHGRAVLAAALAMSTGADPRSVGAALLARGTIEFRQGDYALAGASFAAGAEQCRDDPPRDEPVSGAARGSGRGRGEE